MKWFLALPLAGAMIFASMTAQAAPKEEDDSRTIVHFGDRGPVLIKMHLRIDGVSHRQAWHDLMDELFDHLDKDKKGSLTKAQASAAPPVAALVSQSGFFGGGGQANMDANGDGKVTRTELREFYRKNGLPPFQISGSGRRSDVVYFLADSGRMGGRTPTAEALNNRLFELLDADKDGKLSKEELKALPKALGKLDRDEDEMLTPGELMGKAGNANTGEEGLFRLSVALAEDFDVGGGGADQRFHLLSEERADRAVARRLLDFYAKRGKKVEAKRLGLKKLDRDEDGWLDAEELSRLREMPPDVVVKVRLGKREKDQPLVEVVKKDKALVKVQETKENAILVIDNVRLEFRGPEQQRQTLKIAGLDATTQYRTQFKQADADSNGYLDKKEGERSPFFRNLFAVMDADGDGQLFEKEMLAYLKKVELFRNKATESCCSLVLKDDGQGLFQRLDTDGDGRLSVREIRGAAKALLALDSDSDGKLAKNEVPRLYRGAFEQGSVSGGESGQIAFVRVLGRSMDRPPPAERTKGPVWFRKMDRNRDGDVSRKEWLGTARAFDEIDTDKDGLISVAEAEAYDKKKREKEE